MAPKQNFLFFFFFHWWSLSTRPLSLSFSFDYPHIKIQIPQDTNSLSQYNYKMLYATVNTTSVPVTVCICHERRQKQNEFALMKRKIFFLCVCCLLTVLWAFVPSSPQISLNVSHGIYCRREHICMRASCFDRLSDLPSPFQHEMPGIFHCLSCSLFLLCSILFSLILS